MYLSDFMLDEEEGICDGELYEQCACANPNQATNVVRKSFAIFGFRGTDIFSENEGEVESLLRRNELKEDHGIYSPQYLP